MSEFDFDELLEDVLKEEARVEARVGLERRVLSALQADAQRRWWRVWFPAGALAALAIVAVLMVRREPVRPARVVVDTARIHAPGVAGAADAVAEEISPVPPIPQKRVPQAGERKRDAAQRLDGSGDVGEEHLPKLETFPALTQRRDFFGASIAASPEAVQAMRELKAEQERPLEIEPIEIKPL